MESSRWILASASGIELCITSRAMRYVAVLAALLGCSSSNFEVAPPPDTGVPAADTGAVVADSETPPADTGDTVETAVPDTALPPCTELVPNPPTVFVDKRSKRMAQGTSDCPFPTIKDALAFVAGLPGGSGKHTVQVVGGIAGTPLVYDEPMLVIKPGTELRGDGAERVVITGGGACGTEGAVCMVIMEGNTALEGVTIDAKGLPKIPLAIGAPFLNWVVVKSTTVRGAADKTPAMLVDGAGIVELGPELKINDNASTGIFVKSTGSIKLNGFNQINRNLLGVYMVAGTFDINGATEVIGNKSVGVAIAASDKKHTIDGAIITDNASYGVYVDGAGLKMRRTKLVRNDIGLMFRFLAGGNELDLGTHLSPGANILGAKLEANKRAAICLPTYRSTSSPARGNALYTCPTTPTAIGEGEKVCDTLPADYRDVYYGAPAVSTPAAPLDLGGCYTK